MRVIADLHLHSKYSRATSPRMVISEMAKWADLKGIDILGTGDFTHPAWFSLLKKDLKECDNGLYIYGNNKKNKFILTAEISSIYSQGGKCRRIHNVIMAPSLETVEKINKKLGLIGNLYSDGRPILGLSAESLAKIVLNIDSRAMVIPAHMWTPWFSLYGSNSGFDSINECYGEMTKYIYAGETGLSSDPEMNWRLKDLDRITLISNSDAHSPANLGREANVFNVSDKNYNYDYICEIIRSKDQKYFPYTIEFYPEEGKYHFDGHRNCDALRLAPKEAIKNKNICPRCGKKLTIGVLHRVEELADRAEGFVPTNFPGSRHLVPLQEIIAEVKGVTKTSKKIQDEYFNIIQLLGNEFSILLDIPKDQLLKHVDKKIVEGIINVRENRITPLPGYDGVYGIIKVLNQNKSKEINGKRKSQSQLF